MSFETRSQREIIDRLLLFAEGDLGLVREAIRSSAEKNGWPYRRAAKADLEDVVAFIAEAGRRALSSSGGAE